METKLNGQEWANIWHHTQLDIGLLHAYYIDHAFPRHSHDYYVICLIKQGFQSFTHDGSKYYTPPGGVILINPGVVHTGEAADQHGFEMVCLYPSPAQMQKAAIELSGRQQAVPFFAEVRVDAPWVAQSVSALHRRLTQSTSPLEAESCLTWVLAQLIKWYGHTRLNEQPLGQERKAVRQARCYIDEHYAQGISLTQLAEHVALSPYYLLRVFRAEVGMPPYAYLESVRIRQAQRLIEAGQSLVEIAVELGFSSQSHLTSRFKQIIGVTPGYYAQQILQ